jgi:hypothetical protein
VSSGPATFADTHNTRTRPRPSRTRRFCFFSFPEAGRWAVGRAGPPVPVSLARTDWIVLVCGCPVDAGPCSMCHVHG